jgi:PKD repeat protein
MFRQASLLIGVFFLAAFYSCQKDDPIEDPIASFRYDVDEDNFLEIHFMNLSQNAETFSWNFGDGNSSTEKDPIHVYDEVGNYNVVLTATNSAGVTSTFSLTVEVKDPNEALTLLAGLTSKTWRLYRVGSSMGVGPDADNPRIWWALENDGQRPCVYYHEFTFHRDGAYVFDDQGVFWGEGGIFPEGLEGTCFEATPSNMVNKDGVDVSAWLGGTHSFTYDPTTNTVTLTGNGAWIGLPKTGTNEEVTVPQNSVAFKISIEEEAGYDLMIVLFEYETLVWEFSYAHYHDPSLEPEVVTEYDPGDDLPDYTPEEMYNTFASTDEADVKYLVPTESDVTVTAGVEDPADPSATPVGEYQRGTGQFADLKFQQEFNIQFDNFTTVSIDVYVPSTNTYTEGGLTKDIMIWIADASTTQNFWESWVQYLIPAADVVTDEWVTYTFNLDEPSEGSTGHPLNRTDLDLIGLTIGGGDHTVDGVFYIRNFKFE